MPWAYSLMYQGPEPAEVRASANTFGSNDSLGTTNIEPGVPRASNAVIAALGSFSLITTVRLSVAVTETRGACGLISFANSARWLLTLLWRWKVATTSWASTARPFTGATGEKWALGLTFAVSVSLSGENSHDSTTSPSISPVV